MTSRLSPYASFPSDLTVLDLSEVESLNSRVQRELTHEFTTDGAVVPETASPGDGRTTCPTNRN